MSKSTGFNERLGGFADRIKSEPVTVPVQQVTPLQQATGQKQEQQQLNVWIPKQLLRRLKLRSVETGQSLKELVTASLEASLKDGE